MEPVGPNEMCEEGVSDLMKNLLPERYLYKLIFHHVNEYTENTISCDLEFRVNVNSEKEVKTFLSDLNSSTCCSFNIQSGRQDRRPKGDKARSSSRIS